MLERLRAEHGDLIVHLSGGCCDGSSPMCLRAADLPAGPHDVELGTLAGVPVVIDGDQDSRWRHPSFHLDVAAGAAGGFSLEALEDLRFTAGSGACRHEAPVRSLARRACVTVAVMATVEPAWQRPSLDDGQDAEPQRLGKRGYEKELERLQVELARLQEWIVHEGLKVVVLFEGRDTAGKGGTIKRITEKTNPRVVRTVALGTPTERERTQWYFQRYVAHLPAAGEMVLFDRSWYNRAGVEHVMGFCTQDEYEEFMRTCPQFERDLLRSGIILVKYWLSVSDEEQERRFKARLQRPGKAVEAQRHGPRGPQALGRLRRGEGRHVRLHRHARVAVVRGRGRRQADDAAEPHQPPAEPDPLRGRAAREDQAPAAAEAGVRPTRRSATRTTCPRATWSVRRSRAADEHAADGLSTLDVAGIVAWCYADGHRGGRRSVVSHARSRAVPDGGMTPLA